MIFKVASATFLCAKYLDKASKIRYNKLYKIKEIKKMNKDKKITNIVENGDKLTLQQWLEKLETTQLLTNKNVNGRVTIKQTQRNELRNELATKFYDFLIANDIDAYITKKGIYVAVNHADLGQITVELKVAIKALDFDLNQAIDMDEAEEQ